MSVVLQEGGDRGAPALALARVRAPSDTTNGTSSSKGTSHSKGQRSSSSTYHRQRRHSDFCEYGSTPPRTVPGPKASALCYVRYLGQASNGNPLKPITAKGRISYKDAGTVHGTWRQERIARLRDESETETAASPRADTLCALLPVCSPGFSFLSLLPYLFPVSQLLTSQF